MKSTPHSTAKGSKPKAAAPRKVSHMRISKAKNGFETETHMEQPKTRGDMMSYQEPEKHVFPDAASMQQHIAKSFGPADEAAEESKEKEA